MKSVVLLSCYFGRFPWYFTYFLESCKYNSSVSFVIITDNEAPNDLPANVRIVNSTLEEISRNASGKLGLKVSIEKPYKLCDFKPVYGYLFPEHTQGFDFWGHCDIDVIFGNIRNFIMDEMLDEYEFISVRHDYISGHFALYKNNEKMNELFMQSKDYKRVLGSLFHHCFDETNFAWEDFRNGLPFEEIKTDIESMTHVVKRLAAQGKLKAYFDFHIVEGTPGQMTWDKGTLIFKRQFEVMMYHLIRLKEIYHPKRTPVKLPQTFKISPTKIYS
jgi:hypothetical protein